MIQKQSTLPALGLAVSSFGFLPRQTEGGLSFSMPQKSYSEKLRDPRWYSFRASFIARTAPTGDEVYCPECGEDSGLNPIWHVHHRHYFYDREPWEYEDGDLRLMCDKCHEAIHSLERRVRDFIREMRPTCVQEFSLVMDELDNAILYRDRLKVALAHAKNSIRSALHS